MQTYKVEGGLEWCTKNPGEPEVRLCTFRSGNIGILGSRAQAWLGRVEAWKQKGAYQPGLPRGRKPSSSGSQCRGFIATGTEQ